MQILHRGDEHTVSIQQEALGTPPFAVHVDGLGMPAENRHPLSGAVLQTRSGIYLTHVDELDISFPESFHNILFFTLPNPAQRISRNHTFSKSLKTLYVFYRASLLLLRRGGQENFRDSYNR